MRHTGSEIYAHFPLRMRFFAAAGGRMRVKTALAAAGAALLALGLLLTAARLHWHAGARRARARLADSRQGLPACCTGDWRALPLPVQRYLRRAIGPATRPAGSVRLAQEGTFNVSESGERWLPFSAEQLVVLRRPGFVWEARLGMLPGAPVLVRDSYLEGGGLTEARLLGLWPLASVHGGGEIARGQLIRFLAESPWYPAVLLPGNGVEWAEADWRSARASLRDGAVRAEVTFVFGEDDFVLAVHAADRPRASGGRLAPAPWIGRFGSYAERDGFFVPLEGEVSWATAEGPRPYWRGRIVRIEYDPVF